MIIHSPVSWPYVEARKVIEKMEKTGKDVAVFETGYGPSGLPHIGTFAEVVRTSYVRRAYTELTGKPSILIAFSDDKDALRKTPDNIPNKHILDASHGLPLTAVPDPYGEYESFAHHNNAMLRRFLSECGFEEGVDYHFASSTAYYASGRFNDALHRMAEVHDDIVNVVAPTLGAERRASWSPFMPIHPVTGHVMMVPILEVNTDNDTIRWNDGEKEYITSILNGDCKIQWKADWALRWYALDIDYEMSGKDLIESVKLSSKICRVLGKDAPINLTYELFLDLDGGKISKSKGNGVSVDSWLQYSDMETLSHMIFAKPQTAKKIGLTMIPKSSDEFLANVARLETQTEEEKRNNPAWFAIGSQNTSNFASPVGMQMMLNLANVSDTDDVDLLMKYVSSHAEMTDEQRNHAMKLASGAVNYYKDIMQGSKAVREPNETERKAFEDLVTTLNSLDDNMTAEEYQYHVYEIGKRHPFNNLRDWFKGLYEVLLGQSDGPRFGQFIKLYGKQETVDLISKVLV